MKAYIGDTVVVTTDEGMFYGVLVTRAKARPLIIDPHDDGEWFHVPGEIEQIEVVKGGFGE